MKVVAAVLSEGLLPLFYDFLNFFSFGCNVLYRTCIYAIGLGFSTRLRRVPRSDSTVPSLVFFKKNAIYAFYKARKLKPCASDVTYTFSFC